MIERMVAPEVVVCGAGLTGCLAAVAAAEAGRRVAVLEKRAYPGREIAAYNHSFIGKGGGERALRRLPADFQRIFSMFDAEGVFVPEGFVRQELLRLLEKRKIPVLFEADAAGLSASGRMAGGVLAAAPPGLIHLSAGAVIDATERAHLVRLVQHIPYLPAGNYTVHAVFEFEMPAAARQEALALPPQIRTAVERELGLIADSLRFHATLRADALAVEFAFPAGVAALSPHSLSRLEELRQERSLRLALRLRETVGAFAAASLTHLAYECRVEGHELPPETGGGFDNLLAAPALGWGFSLDDVAAAWTELQAAVAGLPLNPAPGAPDSEVITGGATQTTLSLLNGRDYPDAGLPLAIQVMEWNGALPVRETLSCDVCVVGAGAAGGTAATAAAAHGLRVIATELNQLPGGTFAPGRVIGTYGGYRGGEYERLRDAIPAQASGKLQSPGQGGINYCEYLRNRAAEGNAAIYGGTRFCGVRRDGDRVAELLFANESGLFAVRPGITIDATGNADVAAAAGAEFDLGDPEDGMQQSFSMWGAEVFATANWLGGRYSSDPDVVSPELYSERLRAVSLGHRDNSYFHISPMATVREGRRIRGEAGLRLDDILNRRVPDDAIAVATTSCDSHAHLSSPLAGFTAIGDARPMQVRIPYGCFLPQQLEGLLVGAKAISGERDATSFCRMNSDMVNQGYALGCAAAAALAAGGRVREVDLAALRRELRAAGILPDWAFEDSEAVAADILSAAGDERFQEMLTFPAAEALPLLEERWRKLPPSAAKEDPFPSERSTVALALAWYGSAVGGDRVRELLELARKERMHLTPPPVNPDRTRLNDRRDTSCDYHRVNRLLVMAGRSGAEGFTAALAAIIDDTAGPGEPVARIMPYDVSRKDVPTRPFHRRLYCLAFAAERHPDAALVPALDGLLRRSGAGGRIVPLGSGAMPDYMPAYLDLCLARAAFRCGSSLGKEILTGYLDDTHSIFRENARRTLQKVTPPGR